MKGITMRVTYAVMILVALLTLVNATFLVVHSRDRVAKDREMLSGLKRESAGLSGGDRLYVLSGEGGSADMPSEFVRRAGTQPRGQQFVGVWRGEWFEWYAPWSGESTLLYSQQRYWRSFGGELLVTLAILLASTGAATWIAKRRANEQ